MRGSLGSILALICLAAGPAGAAEPHPERWTAEDIVRAESAEGVALAPDGAFAVWAKQEVRKVEDELERVSNLHLSRFDRSEPLRLTRGPHRDARPAVSPDGAHVAFLSDRKVPGGGEEIGETQLWAIPVGGGEAFPVTRSVRPPKLFGWIDADTLIYAAQEAPSRWELERKQADDDTVVVDDVEHEPPVRLFTVALDGSDRRRLTTNDDWIDRLAVSPEGTHAVVRAQQSLTYRFDQKVPPRTFVVDLRDGAAREVLAGTDLLPASIRWAPDGGGFYFTNRYTTHPRYRNATITHLWFLPLDGERPQRVPLDWERGLGGDWEPVPGGVVALLADGVRYEPARLERDGDRWHRRDLVGRHAENLFAVEVSRDGSTLVYEHSTATVPPQLFAAGLSSARLAEARQITRLNRSWKGKPTGRVEVVRWIGAEGDEVEGLLHYPLDWRQGERRPLILDIHGGPAGTDMDRWSQSWAAPNILWRQRGAFVLQANYHGSAGYGLEWAESIEQRYYELEIPDLERGVDAMIERGLADPDRLASSGWSNGGILTAELITRTDRYKAASVGAADVEWISDWANVDFGAAFDNYYFGGPPWERLDHYVEKSPFFRLTEVTTPTIIYTGTKDRNVPPHQSWSLYRALQQLERAPTRLVLFPGAPHGLRDPAHQRRKIEEDLAFFGEHLFERPREGDPPLADGSPLAALLARSRAARHDGRLGVGHEGTLIPETARLAGLEVSRFEITRAQWRAYAGGAVGGEPDLPVTGLSLTRARGYADWLAETTGRPFRLPTREEAESLASVAGSKGNTLDRWAGYSPNPEDAARLVEAVERVGASPLLEPVGTFPGVGETPVFDLDGNAAEWAVTGDGAGVPVGPSADRPAEPVGATTPDEAYVGLRVVVGPSGGAGED